MLLNDLAKQICREVGVNPNLSRYVAIVEVYIDYAYKELASEGWWNFLKLPPEEIVSLGGQAEYQLDSAVMEITGIRIEDVGVELAYKSHEMHLAEGKDMGLQCVPASSDNSEKYPETWWISSYDYQDQTTNFSVWRVPADASITFFVYGQKRTLDLVSGEDIPVPHAFLPALKHNAKAQIHLMEDRVQLGQSFQQMYMREIEKLMPRFAPDGPRFPRIGELSTPTQFKEKA